jgi:transposase
MRNKKTRIIKVERVDDIPVLWHQLNQMQVAALLDQRFPTHGHWKGELTFGEVVADWLIFILSEGDHCLSHVEPWAKEHLETLSGCAGKRVRPLDFSDDRLADMLEALADTARWNEFETALNGHLLRVYELDGDHVRIDSTTAKTYAGVSPDGLFQFGHSKDHRPDLPQVKVNLSVLDPLGLPLTTTVVGGQSADDPLYVPEIQRVQQSLGAGGKTYIGDCKMGALATRASVASTGDYYLCPLAGSQMPESELEALLKPVLGREQALVPVHDPDTGRRKEPVRLAEGYEVCVAQTATVDGQPVHWIERRLVVRSIALAQQQAKGLEKRLQQAIAEIEQLNLRKQGKKRLAADQLPAAAQAIVQRRGVEGLIQVEIKTTQTKTHKRQYGGRPAQVVSQSHSTVQARIDAATVAAAKARLGWRVYATNHPRLRLAAVVLAYREQYWIERGFGRLKGRALSLTPLYLHTNDRVLGLIRLLTLALRLLTLLEFVVRRQLANTGTTLPGLYASHRRRATDRPTAERILRAFRGISLVIEQVDGQKVRRLSPLSPLQKRLLQLLSLSVDVYLQLVKHFQKPAPF